MVSVLVGLACVLFVLLASGYDPFTAEGLLMDDGAVLGGASSTPTARRWFTESVVDALGSRNRRIVPRIRRGWYLDGLVIVLRALT